MEASTVEIDAGLVVPEFVERNAGIADWARQRSRELLERHRGIYLHEVPITGEYLSDRERLEAVLAQNLAAAMTELPEVVALERLGQLDADWAAGDPDRTLSPLNRLLAEQALLKLVQYKLDGEPAADAFHPQSHAALQLSDAGVGKRLAVTNSTVRTEYREGEEYTYKRALVYDPSKPEGQRFYSQDRYRTRPRPAEVAPMTSGEPEHPVEDDIKMKQAPQPVSDVKLLEMIRELAESNSTRSRQGE
jgi:hypothetical protein